MRRSAFAIVLASLAAGCARRRRTASSEPIANGSGSALSLLVLGDSLAFGTGAAADGGFAWRTYRALARAHPSSEITNIAVGGATAADVLRIQVPRLAQRPRADVVMLCVGGNDVTHFVNESEFIDDYAETVRLVRERESRAVLVLCGVPDVALSPIFASNAKQIEARTRAFDAAVRTIARDVGAVFFDLYALTRAQRGHTAAFLAEDQFHPSDAGHALIARALVPIVEKALATRRG